MKKHCALEKTTRAPLPARVKAVAPATLAALALMWAAPGAASAEYWAYTTDSGTRAYTDDRDAIPERYRTEAVRESNVPLSDYQRSSTILRHPDMRSLHDRRVELDAAAPGASGRQVRSPRGVSVDLGGGLEVEVADAGDAPLRVERSVHRWEGGRLHSYTIVKQGDRVLAEIRDTPAAP